MKLTVCEYIVKKLKHLGIKDVFSLPGDYNFNILDAIINSGDINQINCTNELNAGYAAEGYARINGCGAIVTTYGVGELSAINAIAGAYSENLPVIHIAGVPKTSFIKNKVPVHHNYPEVDYFVFEKIYENVTRAYAYLTFENAKSEIDRVFEVMVNTKQPVYLALPIDVCCQVIEDEGFDRIEVKKSNPDSLNSALNKIKGLIENSKNPVLFVDYLVKRFNLQKEVEEFLNKTNMPSSTLLMGKGAIDENRKNYLGTYSGNLCEGEHTEIIKNSDLIITLGFINADLNTGGFSAFIDKKINVEINKTNTKINGEEFKDVLIQDIVPLLAGITDKKFDDIIKPQKLALQKLNGKEKVKLDEILPEIESLFDENDIFVMETGILSLAGCFLKLKSGMEYLSQTLWGSIGWATPASFGAIKAGKNRNLILFTGEGSHQLTIQEMANFFEFDLKPVIFVLNNGGYTVERVLSKDKDDKFNNITNWDYLKLIKALSNGKDYFCAKIKKRSDFSKVLEKIRKHKGKKLCYVEIYTDPYDFGSCGLKLVSNMKKFGAGLE